MYHSSAFKEIPNKSPGLYALYDGFRGNKCVYVGKSDTNLRRRITHHLDLRISTVTAGAAGASINVENLTMVRWWTHENFSKKDYLDAAETLAFVELDTSLRSRGKRLQSGESLLQDAELVDEIKKLLKNPDGEIELLSFGKLYQKIMDLEERISTLEKR